MQQAGDRSDASAAARAASLVSEAGRYYRERYRQFGDSARGMDWKDRDSQYLRFEVISRYVDWSREPSVLDVGCGNGEFLAYCRERRRRLRYRGVDVCEEMVTACRRRFGAESAGLGNTDRLETRSWDYVIASGTFNVKQVAAEEDWRRYFHHAVGEMFAACRVAAIFNVMTSFVDFRYDHLYYSDCGEMSELAVACGTRDFLIDHSYPLYEMTVVLRRPAAGPSP